MGKTWSQQLREHERTRRAKERQRATKARRRKWNRRIGWVNHPLRTAFRQMTGRR